MNGATFTKTFLPLRSLIERVCLSMLKNDSGAKDMVQDVYLKLWEERERLDEVRSPKAYAIRVARNHCLDKLKSPASQLKSDLDSTQVEVLADAWSDPHEQLVAQEKEEKLKKWASELKEPQRSIFRMRQYEMLSNQETADRLGLEESTVRSALSRLRKEARSLLLDETNKEKENKRCTKQSKK